jgi:hypothetical protein
MKKLFYPVILILLLACVNSLYSQSVSTFTPNINNIPTSPEAALLGRFGDIPIGYYTGTAGISIPLYTIKEAGVEIPIKLDYHSSGIKVADEATWVGLGWSLAPEGTIIQEIRGKKDDEDDNLQQNQFPSEYNAFKSRVNNVSGVYYSAFQTGDCDKYPPNAGMSCVTLADDPYKILFSLSEGNGQPDIYHYNFAGYSGKFYINPETSQVVLIDKKEDITFEKINNGGWIVKTLDGSAFHFNDIETSHAWVITELSGITYKLSKIYFNNGKSANFTYQDEQSLSRYYNETTVLDDHYSCLNCPIPFWPQSSSDFTYGNKKTLTKITTSDVTINFNLEDRDDIISSNQNIVKRLKSIDILSLVTNKKIKSFEFGYSYFPYNSVGKPTDSYTAEHETALGKRLKLDSIKEIGYDINGLAITSKPAHEFNYDLSITMPLRNSFAVDFWGYYNGEYNDKLLPDLAYFDFPSNNFYKDLYPLTYNYTGANRYTNNSFSGAYMLNTIKYPTGGFSEFEYEPNSFTNQFIPNSEQINISDKLVILQDQNYSNNTTTSNFELTKTTIISFVNSIYDGYIGSQNPVAALTPQQMAGSFIQLRKVDMTNGSGTSTVIKSWDLSTVLNVDFETNHGVVWNEDIEIEYDPNPNVYYEVKTYLPNNIVNNSYGSVSVKSRFTYFDSIDTSISNQCGMRIKTIKNYTKTGSLASHKSIRYYDGKLLNKFEPLEQMPAMYNSLIGMNTHSFFSKRTSISSNDFGTNGGNLIGYSKVEEIELDTLLNTIGKKVFHYINNENQVRKGFPNSANLKNGFISKEEIFDNLSNKLLEKSYTYLNLSPFISYSGIKIKNHSFGNTDTPGMINFTPNPYQSIFHYKYSYGFNPINSEWNKLEKIETNQFFDNDTVTSTESYTYNNLGKIQTITSTNSNNESLIKKVFYSNDGILNNWEMAQDMTTSGMLGIPVYTKNYKGTKLLNSQKTLFEKTGVYVNSRNVILPKYIYSSKNTTALEKRITYHSYDNKGNPLEISIEDDSHTAYIWGYNQKYPIAKIENSTYAEVSGYVYGLQYYSDLDNDRTIDTIEPDGSITPVGNEGILRDFSTTLRNNTALQDKYVTTYTYDPLIGVTSITDPKGYTIYYVYDAFNRLEFIKDTEGNILSKNEYNYKQ